MLRHALDLMLRAIRVRRLVPITLSAILAIASVPSVLAGVPAPMSLNPEPPDSYACRPVGDGTICRAHVSDSYAEPTGVVCGSGGSAVELIDSGIRDVDATRWYDRDGNMTRRLRMNLFRDAHISNPDTGQVLGYAQHNTDNEVLAVPGDLDSITWTGHGVFSVTAPGFGAVLLGAGRTVVGPDGEVQAESGIFRFFADDLCAALGTPNG